MLFAIYPKIHVYTGKGHSLFSRNTKLDNGQKQQARLFGNAVRTVLPVYCHCTANLKRGTDHRMYFVHILSIVALNG